MSERFKLIGGVLIIILNDKNEVLMTLRKNKFDSDKYSLPGGCMEDGETVKQAAVREIFEETNLNVKEKNIQIVSAMHRITPWNWQSIEYVLVTRKFTGTAEITEPDKCSDLRWFDLNTLPHNISDYAKRAIDNYINNETFSEIVY